MGRILLTVSAICLIIGMGFTYLYAVSEFSGHYLVIIPQMVRFHGITNALGFAMCGLLTLNMLRFQRP
ncbi:MAG TPA: YndJ family transporter [Anaerolineae bacterium]|nr:YndJ family transporter [Anaerolineae bacterium]